MLLLRTGQRPLVLQERDRTIELKANAMSKGWRLPDHVSGPLGDW